MTHRQEAARETRRKIIGAGRALVEGGGFAAASVDAITRAAGVAKGTFYVHFPTKEHLAAEICREPYEKLSRDVMIPKVIRVVHIEPPAAAPSVVVAVEPRARINEYMLCPHFKFIRF